MSRCFKNYTTFLFIPDASCQKEDLCTALLQRTISPSVYSLLFPGHCPSKLHSDYFWLYRSVGPYGQVNTCVSARSHQLWPDGQEGSSPLSLSALCYLCEGGEHVQHSSLLHRACVVQVFLLQVDLHAVLFGESGVLHTGKKKRSSV